MLPTEISPEVADKTRQILKRFEKLFSGRVNRTFYFAEALRLLTFGFIRIDPVNKEALEQRDCFAKLLAEFDPSNSQSVEQALRAIQKEFPKLYSPLWQLDGSGWYPLGSLYGDIRELESLIIQGRHQPA